MDTRRIPVIISLVAVMITCVVSILQGVSFSIFTMRFLCSALVFLFIGSIIKIVVDYSFKVIEEENPAVTEDGEIDENLENIDSDENIMSDEKVVSNSDDDE